jgi:hypothetical protein
MNNTNMPGQRAAVALFLIGLCLPLAAPAQVYEGLTLYNTMYSRTMRLIDNNGQTINSWSCASGVAYMPYLMPDSTVWRPGVYSGASLRGAAYGGLIERYNWDGDVIESFVWSDQNHQQHHDIQPMPNCNVLVMSWDRKTRTEAQSMGRLSINGDIWPDEVIEYDPAGDSVVWQWHFWDHLIQDVDSTKPNYGVISEHPELLDINLGTVMGGDWMHCNAVDYNEEEDIIVFCSHNLHEVYVIDHSTTIEEAAGHTGGRFGKGGDILWRWGNPQNYDRGTSSDRVFYVVHGANWIRPGLRGTGHILIFNNGDRPGSGSDYSVVMELEPPRDSAGNYYIHPDSAFGPDSAVWSYSNPGTFYSQHLSGAFRLPNDNTFMVEGTRGRITEVTWDGTIVWQYNLGSQIGRCAKYPLDFTGFSEKTPASSTPARAELRARTPFSRSTAISYSLPSPGQVTLTVCDACGRTVSTLVDGQQKSGRHEVAFAPQNRDPLPAGVYFARLAIVTETEGRSVETIRLTLVH